MFNISNFLGKFSKEINDSESKKSQVSEIIKNITGVEIKTGDIEIKDYIVFIKSNPSVLNKIFINKNKILESILSSTSIKVADIK